jgi:hypothetical protein
MENKDQDRQLIEFIDKMFDRIIKSGRLSFDEILVLCQFGIITGLTFINDIIETIELKGQKPAGKKFSGDKIDLMLKSMDSEFNYRTGHFFNNGFGAQIPLSLSLAHLKVTKVIQDLDVEMLYGNDDLSQDINQRELAYLFSALSNAEIFHQSPDLLANALEQITNYSQKSIRRVILDFKKTIMNKTMIKY